MDVGDITARLNVDIGNGLANLQSFVDGMKAVGNAATQAADPIDLVKDRITAVYMSGNTSALDALAAVMKELGGNASDASQGLRDWAAAMDAAMDAAASSAKSAGDAMGGASEGARQYSEAAQSVIDKQAQLDGQLQAAQAVLAELQQAYNNGAASADAVARAAENVGKAFDAAHPGFQNAQSSFEQMASDLTALGEALAITAGLKAFGEAALAAADNVTRASVALTTITGSAEQAQTTIKGLEQLGMSDGLALPSLYTAATRMQQLLGPGADVVGILGKIADGAAVMGTDIGAAANAFDRLVTSGNASARTLMPLGLNMDSLAEAMNKLYPSLDATSESAKKLFKDGLNDEGRIAVVTQALTDLGGTAQKVADQTFGGQWQRLENEWEVTLQNVGKALMPAITSMTNFAGEVAKVVESATGAFNKLPEPIQMVAGQLAILAAAAIPITAGLAAAGIAISGLGTLAATAGAALETIGGLFASAGAAAATAAPEVAALGAAGDTAAPGLVAAGEAGTAATAGITTAGEASTVAAPEVAAVGEAAVVAAPEIADMGAAAALAGGEVAEMGTLSTTAAAEVTGVGTAATTSAIGAGALTLGLTGLAIGLAELALNADNAAKKLGTLLDQKGIDLWTIFKDGIFLVTGAMSANEVAAASQAAALADLDAKTQGASHSALDYVKTLQDLSGGLADHAEKIAAVSDKFVAYSAALREFHDISSSVTSDEQSQSDVMTALANKVADTAKSLDNAKQSLGFWVDQLNQAEEGSAKFTEAQQQVDKWLALLEKDQGSYNKALDDFNNKSGATAAGAKAIADNFSFMLGETLNTGDALRDMGAIVDGMPGKMSPLNQALSDAGIKLKGAADAAKDARGSFDNLNSELPAIVSAFNNGQLSADNFDKYLQAMSKDINQLAKVDLPGATAQQGQFVDKLIASNAPLGVIQTEMAKYQTGINKLAHEDLPDAIAAQEHYTQELIASNAPLGQILDSQQKQIQLQIQLAQQSGQSTGALLIDLENVKLKQEEVKASLEGWGPAYVQAIANIQASFTSLHKGLADIIVSGKDAQEVFAGLWKSFATAEVNTVITQALKPLEKAFLDLGNHAGDAAKKIADSASAAGKSLSQMGEAEAMSAEVGEGAAKGAENLSTGMDGISNATKDAAKSFASFASSLSGVIALMTAAYEAGKLLGGAIRDMLSGPSSLNITSNIPIAGLSGSQVTDLAKWLGLDTSNMAGLGTQGNPLTNPGQSPTADQTAGAIGALTTEIQRLTELQTGLNNEMIQAYDKGQIYLGDTLSKDLDTVANAIKSEQAILDKISGNTGATADGTQAVVATNGQMYSALGSATAQLISMQGQQATLQSELLAAQASGNTALATALQSQLDKLNSSIGGQTTLLQQVTDAVKTLSPDILTGFQTLQEGFKAITDLKSSPELEQAMNNLRVALESGDIASIDKATGVLQQILIGVNNPPAVVTAINALQEAIKSGDTAAIAQATTTLQSAITTSASNSATAISAAEKEVGDAIVTGNAAALSKGLADLSTAIGAANKQQGEQELAALQSGLKPTADQISAAIGSLETSLGNLQQQQTDLNNDLIIAVASGDQNLISAIQTELGKVNTSIQADQNLLNQINTTTGAGADKVVSSVDGVKASTDQMQQALDNAKASVDSLKGHLSDLNQQLIIAEAAGNSTLVATLEKQIGDTNSLLNTANTTLNQIDQDISDANPVNDNSGAVPTTDQSADATKNLQNTINGYLAQETDINNQIKIALSAGDTKQVEKLESEWNRINGLLTEASNLMKQLTGATGLPDSKTGGSSGSSSSSLPSNALTNDEMGKLTAQQLAAYNNATKAVNDLKAQQIPLQNQLIAAEAAGNSTLVKTIQDQLSKLNGQITSANTTLTDVVVAIRAGNSATTGAGGAGAGAAGGAGPVGSTPVSQGGGQQPTVPGQSVFFPTTASGQWDPEFQLREIAKQIQDNSAVIQMGNDTGNDIFNEQLGKMNATLLAQQALLQNPPSNPSAAVMDLRTQITMDTQQMITAWLNGDRAGADSIRQKIDEEIGKLADISKADDSTAGSVANVEKAAIDQRNAALASLSEATTTKEKIAALTEQMKADEILATEEAKQGHQDAANAYSKEAIALQAQLNELQNNGRDIRDTKASSDKAANNTEKTAANTLRSAVATENARSDLAKQQMDLLQNLAGLALAIATGDAGLATVFANKIAENIAAIKEDQGILNGIADNTKRTADNTDGIGSIADAISGLKDSIGSTRGGADTQTSSTGRSGNNTGTDTSSPGQVAPPTGREQNTRPHYASGGYVPQNVTADLHAGETVIDPGLTTGLSKFLDFIAPLANHPSPGSTTIQDPYGSINPATVFGTPEWMKAQILGAVDPASIFGTPEWMRAQLAKQAPASTLTPADIFGTPAWIKKQILESGTVVDLAMPTAPATPPKPPAASSPTPSTPAATPPATAPAGGATGMSADQFYAGSLAELEDIRNTLHSARDLISSMRDGLVAGFSGQAPPPSATLPMDGGNQAIVDAVTKAGMVLDGDLRAIESLLTNMSTAAGGASSGSLSGNGGGISPTSSGTSSGGSGSGGTSTTTPQGTFAAPPAQPGLPITSDAFGLDPTAATTFGSPAWIKAQIANASRAGGTSAVPPSQPGMPITSDAFGGAFDPTAATTFGSPAWIKAQVANAAKSGGSFDPTAATSFGSPAWIKAQVAGNKALDPTAATTFGSPAWLKAQVASAQPSLSSGLKTHPGLVGPPLAATPEQLAALKAAADAADAAANAAKGDAAGKDHIAKALEDSIASMQLTVEELTTKLQLQRAAAAQARAQATDTGDPAMAKQADLAESIAESYDQQLTAQVKALNDTRDRATKARADADAAAKIAADKQSAADAADAAYGSAKSGAGSDTGGFTTISSAFQNPEQEGSFPQLSGPTRGTSTVGGSGHVNQDITLKSGSTMSQDQVDALTKYAQEHPANGGMPHYALGGYVPTDGPAMLHAKEYVVPPGGFADYLASLGGTSLDGMIASHLKHPFDPSAAMNIGGSLGAGGGLLGGVKQGPVPGASGGNVTVHAPVTFNGYTDTAKMYRAWAGHVKGVTKNAAPFSS